MRNLKLIIQLTGFFIAFAMINSCKSLKPSYASLKPVESIKNGSLSNYKYIYIFPTNSLTSNSGATIGGQYYSSSQTINTSDVIIGKLLREGFIRIPELKPELAEETLIINYGESGKRNTGLGGYTLEVTIQFISAKDNKLIRSCTAEGQGYTEADDIRQAITRCLDEIILKGK